MLCNSCNMERFPPRSSSSSSNNNTGGKTPAVQDLEPTASTPILENISILARGNTKHSLCDFFTKNLDNIFRYSVKDIQQELNKVDMPFLTSLHKAMCEQAQTKFTQYKDQQPVNRQMKKTVIPDIYHLGFGIINGTTSKEMDKIFVSKTAGSPNTEELHELLHSIAVLTRRVNALEITVSDLSSANEALKCSLSDLLSQTNSKIENSQAAEVATTRTDTITPDLNSSSSSSEESESETQMMAEDQEPFTLPRRSVRKARRKAQRAAQQQTSNHPVAADPPCLQPSTTSNQASSPTPSGKTYAKVVSASSTKCADSGSSSTLENATLRAAPTTTQASSTIYIGGVDAQHTTHDIVRHLRSIGMSGHIQTKVLSTKGDWRSFQVSVPKEQASIALDSSKWPCGLKVRPFHAQASTGIRAAPSSWRHQPRRHHGRHYPQSTRRHNHGGRNRDWRAANNNSDFQYPSHRGSFRDLHHYQSDDYHSYSQEEERWD